MEVSEAEMVGQFDKAAVESDMKLIENDPRWKIILFVLQFLKTGDENTLSERKITSEFLRDHCLTDGAGPELVAVACRGGACRGFMCGLYNTRRGEDILPGSREKIGYLQ